MIWFPSLNCCVTTNQIPWTSGGVENADAMGRGNGARICGSSSRSCCFRGFQHLIVMPPGLIAFLLPDTCNCEWTPGSLLNTLEGIIYPHLAWKRAGIPLRVLKELRLGGKVQMGAALASHCHHRPATHFHASHFLQVETSA